MKSKKGTGIFDYFIEKAVNGLSLDSPVQYVPNAVLFRRVCAGET
jgi:hypothetical protein